MTVAAEDVPSPQATVAEWASPGSASVNVAEYDAAAPSPAETGGAEPMTAGRANTLTPNEPTPTPPSSSDTVTVAE